MKIGLIGRKRGMTRVFTEAGESVPVTVIEAAPNRVTQVKTEDADGYSALQVTTGSKRANLVNNLAIGPITYALATEFFVHKSDPGGGYSLIRSLTSALGLVVTHALGYHYAHSQMHRPQMYWAHKFHHAFAKHVTPSSANAVSVVEYAYAYMLPFVVGCAVCAPDERALLTAVAVISVNNLLIHTPALEVFDEQL